MLDMYLHASDFEGGALSSMSTIHCISPLCLQVYERRYVNLRLGELPLLDQYPCGRVWVLSLLIGQVLRATLSVRELEVIANQEVAKDDFDLVTGEESTRASKLAVSEMEVSIVTHGELVSVGIFRLCGILTQLGVTEGVENLRITTARQVVLVVQDCI